MKFSSILLFALCLDFHSHGQIYDSIGIPTERDSVFINGQIVLSNEKPQTIMFAVWDHWLGIQRIEHAMLDEEGRFEIKFFIRNTNPVFWHEKARELTFLHSFMRALETAPNLDYFYQSMYPLIQNKEFRDLLTREYQKKKEEDALIENNQEGIRVIPKNYEKSANQLLSDIVKANRNKVILIDFWATWCGPCLKDFNAVKPLKEKLPTDSVSFVYICSQSSSDNWIKQIKKYNVQGQHYFISETQYSEFQKRFGLNAFPTYIVIDAKNRIHKGITVRNEELFLNKIKVIMGQED